MKHACPRNYSYRELWIKEPKSRNWGHVPHFVKALIEEILVHSSFSLIHHHFRVCFQSSQTPPNPRQYIVHTYVNCKLIHTYTVHTSYIIYTYLGDILWNIISSSLSTSPPFQWWGGLGGGSRAGRGDYCMDWRSIQSSERSQNHHCSQWPVARRGNLETNFVEFKFLIWNQMWCCVFGKNVSGL